MQPVQVLGHGGGKDQEWRVRWNSGWSDFGPGWSPGGVEKRRRSGLPDAGDLRPELLFFTDPVAAERHPALNGKHGTPGGTEEVQDDLRGSWSGCGWVSPRSPLTPPRPYIRAFGHPVSCRIPPTIPTIRRDWAVSANAGFASGRQGVYPDPLLRFSIPRSTASGMGFCFVGLPLPPTAGAAVGVRCRAGRVGRGRKERVARIEFRRHVLGIGRSRRHAEEMWCQISTLGHGVGAGRLGRHVGGSCLPEAEDR